MGWPCSPRWSCRCCGASWAAERGGPPSLLLGGPGRRGNTRRGRPGTIGPNPAREHAPQTVRRPQRILSIRVVCGGLLAAVAALALLAVGPGESDGSGRPAAAIAVAAPAAPAVAPVPLSGPVRTAAPITPPAPLPPAPLPGLPGVPDPAGTGSACGLTDLGACVGETITGFFRGIVTAALNPLLGLLSDTLLTTPTPDSLPALGGLWDGSWQILLTCYGLLVTVAGILVMAHETLHSRYSVKEIAPRVVVGFLSGAASLPISGQAIGLANAMAQAILGDQLDPRTAGNTLRDVILAAVNENPLFLFMALLLIGMIIGLLVGYVIRVGLTVLLVAGAPIALMFHALPQTEGIAYGWWRAFGGCLAIQVVQSFALVTALKVFLAPGGFTPFGVNRNGLVDMVVALALVWVLYRVPFWVLAGLRRGGGRRSLIASLVRGFLVYRAFGLLTGRGRPPVGTGRGPGTGGPGGGRGGGGPRPRPGPGGAMGAGGGDPYARMRATRGGQYVLPLPGLRRSSPTRPGPAAAFPPPPAGTGTVAGRRGRQLALPLDRDWPENRPVPGRDGQYRLPITVARVPTRRRPATPPAKAMSGRARRGGTQLELPFDPYRGMRPTTSGQYPLPLDVHRTRPAAAQPAESTATARATPAVAGPAATGTTPRSGAGRQLRLPLDLPRRGRRTTPPTATSPPPSSRPDSSSGTSRRSSS